MSFCHLHCHTEYSLLDGITRVKDLVAKALELSMQSCAITDHGVLYGVADFYDTCRKNGLHPVLGMEAYVVPDIAVRDKNICHLVLLAENQTGYSNLLKLASMAQLEGFYWKPRLDHAMLSACGEGLIALSACLKGEIPQAFLGSGMDAARDKIREYLSIFDRDHFYLELQHNGLAKQKAVNEALRELAADQNVKLVATNDCHFLTEKDCKLHELLLCIQTKRTYQENAKADNAEIQDEQKGMHSLPELWFKDEATMLKHFGRDEVELTEEIASRCHVELDFGHYYFPPFALPEGKDPDTAFEEKCWQGFEERKHKFPQQDLEKYRDRLGYEIEVIKNMKFPEYFLVVQEFVNWAKTHGVPVGPGRGSAVGSLVAYCLKITNLDPLPYSLLFERFLNPERVSLPDIDIDFCERRRNEVFQHMIDLYGEDRVAQLATFALMKSKSVLKDVGRVLNYSPDDTNLLTSCMFADPKATLRDNLERNQIFAEKIKKYPNLLEPSLALENIKRQVSVHAAGLVVSPRPMQTYTAVKKNKDTLTIPVTQYEHEWIEKLGLVKFDFLGLKTLTVIHDALESIKRMGKPLPDLDNLEPFDDANVWRMLTEGKTMGVFQLEGEGITSYLKKLAPTCFEDLIAMCALFRPGPLNSGMVDTFIRRKHGYEAVDYYGLDEWLEPILAPTYGVIVYQEQVMQIAQVMAGYTLGGADLLRRAMGKKKVEEMAKQRSIFIQGCLKNNISEKKASDIFDLMEGFAEYGFNKSHSAAYALLSYQTAYLKYYYPAVFFAALLSAETSTDQFSRYMANIRNEFDVEIVLPSINSSQKRFAAIDNRTIAYGFSSISGIKDLAVNEIIAVRDRPFTSLTDFLQRINKLKVTKKDLELLVQSGSLDCFRGKLSRRGLLHLLYEVYPELQRKRRSVAVRQEQLVPLGDNDDDYVQKAYKRYLSVPEYSLEELSRFEQELFSLYFYRHPLDGWRMSDTTLRHIILQTELGFDCDTDWVLVHVVSAENRAKKERSYVRMTIEDTSTSKTVLAFIWNSALNRLQAVFDTVMHEFGGICEIRGRYTRRSEDDDPIFSVRDIRLPVGKILAAPCFELDLRRTARKAAFDDAVPMGYFDWKIESDDHPPFFLRHMDC